MFWTWRNDYLWLVMTAVGLDVAQKVAVESEFGRLHRAPTKDAKSSKTSAECLQAEGVLVPVLRQI